MKITGRMGKMHFRSVDKIGRMCIPKDCINFLGIKPKDKLTVKLNEKTKTLEIQKYEDAIEKE